MERSVGFDDYTSCRTPPVNIDECDVSLFAHEFSKQISAASICRLERAFIDRSGVILSKHKILPQSFHSNILPKHYDTTLAKAKFLLKSFSTGVQKVDRPSIWIAHQWSDNYFHWVTESLTRLLLAPTDLEDSVILLPSRLAKFRFVRESLEPLRCDKVFLKDWHCWCRRLTIPHHRVVTGNYNDMLLRETRDFYHRHISTQPQARSEKRIYISRRNSAVRQIANECECEDTLREFGFKTIFCEDMSFQQQVNTAREADILVSNHGAGLTNLVFMSPGKSVLEFRRDGDAHNNCFFALASAVDVRYFYQLCASESHDDGTNTKKIIVDTKVLRRNLELVIG